MKALFLLPTISYAVHRKLYEVVSTGTSCKLCLNKQNCWEHLKDGSGSWSKSYCCGPSDSKCDGLDYCSGIVSDANLKSLTCPSDSNKCPTGSSAELFTSQLDKPVSQSYSWSNFDIKSATYCKYNIKHTGQITVEKFKWNTMHISLEVSSAGMPVRLATVPGSFKNATI